MFPTNAPWKTSVLSEVLSNLALLRFPRSESAAEWKCYVTAYRERCKYDD